MREAVLACEEGISYPGFFVGIGQIHGGPDQLNLYQPGWLDDAKNHNK